MDRMRRKDNSSIARIGLVLASIHNGAALQMWPAIARQAADENVELCIFPGGRLNARDVSERTRNRIFDIAFSADLRGIVSWASSLGGFLGESELNDFHARWGNIPLVSLAKKLSDKPCVKIDSSSGLLPLMEHLYATHGVRKFAFIRGPEGYVPAEERYAAFVDFHHQKGLPIDSQLVSSYCEWENGAEGLSELLDSRSLVPGKDFSALLAASDMLLYPALLVLKKRGYRIPRDVMVAGFNDTPESRIISPTLTTVRFPFASQSKLALGSLLRMMRGEQTVEDGAVPAELVIRRSCGCLSSVVASAGSRHALGNGFLSESETELAEDILQARFMEASCRVSEACSSQRKTLIEPLVVAFIPAIIHPATFPQSHFLEALDAVCDVLSEKDMDITILQNVLSAFRSEAALRFTFELAARARDLVDRGRVVLAEASDRLSLSRVWRWASHAQLIRDMEKELLQLLDRRELGAVLHRWLPRLDITAACVVEQESDGLFSIIAAFDESGDLPSASLVRFDISLLHPFPRKAGSCWVFEPLYRKDEYLGYIAMRVGPMDGTIYEELRSSVSMALHVLSAMDNLQRAREAAEAAEVQKSRFLGAVAAELRKPLKRMMDTGKKMEAQYVFSQTDPVCIHKQTALLGALTLDLRRQLRLVDDLDDVSHLDDGDFKVRLRLTHPAEILDLLKEETGSEQLRLVADDPLPLVMVDVRRLVRLLAIVIEHASPQTVWCVMSPRGINIELRNCGRSKAEQKDALGRGLALARRLAVSHFAYLEEVVKESVPALWRLRLPLPTLAGVSVLSGYACPRLSADQALRLLRIGAPMPTGAVCVVDHEDVQAEALLQNLEENLARSTNELWAKELAFQIFFAKERYRPDGFTGVREYLDILAGPAARSKVLLCDSRAAKRKALTTAMGHLGTLDIVESSGSEHLESLLSGGLLQSERLLLVFSSGMKGCIALLKEKGVERYPLIILLRGVSDLAVLEMCIDMPRTLVLNEGIYTDEEFADFCAQLLQDRSFLPAYTASIVKKAIAVLNRNLGASITRWQLAEEVHASEDYLTRIFRVETGISPWEYLTRLRMNHARYLLLESGETVRDIAVRCGFHDQAYFCRVFRKYYGESPKAWRDKTVL